MSESIAVNFCGNGTAIVTENADGEIYMITAKYIQDSWTIGTVIVISCRPMMPVYSSQHGMAVR